MHKNTLDRQESIAAFEPLLIPKSDKRYDELMELAFELTKKSVQFKSSLPVALRASLATTVRAMNCYYSNLIEGHNTHPIAIERALKNDYEADPKKRNLQLEAKAHIEVQEWIDNGGLNDDLFSAHVICEIHKQFCDRLPEDLLWITNPDTNEKIKVIPGELRARDVKVGKHIPISPGAIPRFLKRYEEVYSERHSVDMIIALAAAHHRLLWIHPFLDGNGRVARFVSYATTLKLKTLDSGGLWSVARGLARNVEEYKSHLANCDLTRRNDLDGRGNLSQESLVDFTLFFLKICIDQVTFMQELMQPEKLSNRVLLWAREEIELKNLPPQALQMIDRILIRGELPRGDIPEMLNITERHARRITASLIEKGVLTSNSDRSPIKLAFPAKYAYRWLPGLFPEK